MNQYFVHLELEPGREVVFRIENELSVGRAPENDICLSHPAVSRRHALFCVKEGKARVKDLGSGNGTFLNQVRVDEAAVVRGDRVRIGASELKIFQGDDRIVYEVLHPAAGKTSAFGTAAAKEACSRSKRIEDAIAKTPAFSRLGPEERKRLSRKARLLLFDPERVVIRQGDRGGSLFIILDGKVEMITFDNEGREVLVSFLTTHQFFGEMAFLSGNPRSVTVRAVEETLLCELSHDSLREAVLEAPEIGSLLETYYRKRLAELNDVRESKGIVEKRTDPRVRVEVPVTFQIVPVASGDKADREERIVSARSVDISNTGIRVAVDAPGIQIAIDDEVSLRIALPPPWVPVEIDGAVKRMITFATDQNRVLIGIKFRLEKEETIKRLEAFLYG